MSFLQRSDVAYDTERRNPLDDLLEGAVDELFPK